MNETLAAFALEVIAALGVGVAVMQTITVVRRGREIARLNDEVVRQHEQAREARDEAAALKDLIRQYGPAIRETQRRWPFTLPAELEALIDPASSRGDSEWLISQVPGSDLLGQHGERMVIAPRFFAAVGGWTGPPRLAEASANGHEET